MSGLPGDGINLEYGWTDAHGQRWHHPPYGPTAPASGPWPRLLLNTDAVLADVEVAEFQRRFREAQDQPHRLAVLGEPARITTRIPRSRWQWYKARHSDGWLGWYVRRWPVRYRDWRVLAGYPTPPHGEDEDR